MSKRIRWLLAVAFVVCLTNGSTERVEAQTTCAPAVDPPNFNDGFVGGASAQESFTACLHRTAQVSVALYDAVTTIPGGSNRLLLLLPDSDRPASSGNKVKIQTTEVAGLVTTTATCPGGVITGSGTTIVEVELTDGASCTLIANATVSGSLISYKATLTRAGDEYRLSAGTAAGGRFGGKPTLIEVAGRDEDYVHTRTQRVIANFMARRAEQITASDPDLAERLLDRGRTGTVGPVAFTTIDTSANNQNAFSTSLRRIMRSDEATKAEQRAELGRMMGFKKQDLKDQGLDEGMGLDVWIEGKWTQVDDKTRKSDIGLLYVGVDYRFSPSLLVGFLTQFDWMDESDNFENTAAKGHGWLAGPYIVTRLHDNIIFDARAAWGQSDNNVDPLGLYSDSFDTNRWLARGRLTGDFQQGAWRFSPHIGVIYFEESQKSYTDSLGIFIPGQTISLGRLTFGPKIAYGYQGADGTVISPHLGIKGIWDFDKAKIVDLSTELIEGSSDDFRARVEGGLAATFANEWSIRGKGFYDGIGVRNFNVYGASVTVTAPLN